ncbi:depupylase/deamidase Dop [Actinomarinicola tropica]|uniref:Proteasome accessory factor PafA2 n=1 Tax=Actinomarinicola tropica TaxID=2789776 RepID=A0A5Q2REF1_9ACTN|nr:depupylase/deamidase Dop [Actinomarinicola tropica]QGG95298.1 proteasome accessory factor PafA2 [Actinomarinicola tropica]
MATRKIVGIETEYGIVVRGADDSNPIAASSTLINAYIAATTPPRAGRTAPVGWDFEDESPGNDARGDASSLGSLAPEVETHLVNTVLTNGARYYVDHAHPELSTPECGDALDVVRYDRAAELILRRSMAAASSSLPPGQEIVVYKNNSDGKGNSYGCHENYLMDRLVPFGRVVTHITPHFVTRQIFGGAGKVGSEVPGIGRDEVPFQITQRADFFEEEVGLETTLKRPIVNTRDEPHADAQKYRRLHVIVGDANMAQLATFLKVGTTSIVLAMIEDDWLEREIRFAAPVQALRHVSYDLGLRRPLPLADGTTTTALEVQWHLLERARAYAAARGLDVVGEEVGKQVLVRWEEVLTDLEADPMRLADRLDWPAKLSLIERYRERDGLDWDHPRLAALDLQYHDLRVERSLASRLGLEQLVDDASATAAIEEPPEDTRAYFRGTCLRRWRDSVVAANWDSMVFDVGQDPLRRIPMMEPSRGTRAHVGRLLERCETPAELVEQLGSSDR